VRQIGGDAAFDTYLSGCLATNATVLGRVSDNAGTKAPSLLATVGDLRLEATQPLLNLLAALGRAGEDAAFVQEAVCKSGGDMLDR
jgi:hypothetical protein